MRPIVPFWTKASINAQNGQKSTRKLGQRTFFKNYNGIETKTLLEASQALSQNLTSSTNVFKGCQVSRKNVFGDAEKYFGLKNKIKCLFFRNV